LLLPGFLFLLPFLSFQLQTWHKPLPKLQFQGMTGQYEQTLSFSNYLNAFTENKEQFARSFVFALLATVLALAIAYPLAYAIAFKAGRLKNILLVLVVAPFFVSFLLRTVAWKQILGEEGFVCTNPSKFGNN
jgi:spermidine/putrescine transport system permease protein